MSESKPSRFAFVPNLITTLRVLLVPVIVLAVVHNDWHGAAIWFAIAAFTDFLDGYSARRFELTSTAGQFFDPIADKILLVAATLACAYVHRIPIWFVIVVAGRDVLLIIGALAGILFTSYRKYEPTQLGKLSTLLQIGVVMAAFTLPQQFVNMVVWPSALVTASSGIHYLWRAAMGMRTE
jgi:cardiolipin synthase